MEIRINVTLPDLIFIWFLVIWAWYIIGAITHQSILPFNIGAAYIYVISLVLSIPGVPAYIIWKYKKKKERK